MIAETKQPLLIIGSSGHAKVVADAIERGGGHRIVGLIDSFRQQGDTAFGYAVLGTERALPELCTQHGVNCGVIAIGDNWQRAQMALRIADIVPGFGYAKVVHPAAVVADDASLGEGCVVLAGAIVAPGCRVGRFGLLNTRSSLDHDSEMEDFASLGPGVTTGGFVRIGEYSAIAIGTIVRERCTIGVHTVVGAGSVVVAGIPAHCVAYGVPAKVVAQRAPGDAYL